MKPVGRNACGAASCRRRRPFNRAPLRMCPVGETASVPPYFRPAVAPLQQSFRSGAFFDLLWNNLMQVRRALHRITTNQRLPREPPHEFNFLFARTREGPGRGTRPVRRGGMCGCVQRDKCDQRDERNRHRERQAADDG
jgi:hypothetical protein